MTDRKNRKQRANEQLGGPEITHGDERERATLNEGGTLGMVTGFYLVLLTALALALFGHILVPCILLFVGAIPGFVMISYAEKRGVDAFAILARGDSGASNLSGHAALVIALLISAAMLFTTTSGAGLLEFELSQTWSDRLSSTGNGVAVGTGIGAVLGSLAAAWVVMRRKKQHEPDDGEN